jgi:hypothetical protein
MIENDDMTFNGFWQIFVLHLDESSKKDEFSNYLGLNKKIVKHSYDCWYTLYLNFLIQKNKYIDAFTSLYDNRLKNAYPYEVYKDDDEKYFVLQNPTAIMDCWRFVRRYRRGSFAQDFCCFKNKDLKIKENSITDFKRVMEWILADKKIVFKKKDEKDWKLFDPEKPVFSKDYEYQLSDNINLTWKFCVPFFEIKASCKEDAIEKAVEYLKDKSHITIMEVL